MPKNTFFRISEDKQQRIIEAARNEFMTVSYSMASINQIIKNADIPRGSFYQYFDGKEDLFEFLIHEHLNAIFKTLVGELKRFEGDIFACIKHYVDLIVECECSEDITQIKMVFADSQAFEIIWRYVIKEGSDGATNESVLGNIDTTKLNVQDRDELICLIDILATVIRDTMCKLFLEGKEYGIEKSKEVLYNKIDSLQRHYSK